jgi:hypothetical protein
MCLFCAVGSACVLAAGVGVTRVAADGRALGHGRAVSALSLLVKSHSDVIAWLSLILINVLVIYLGLMT